MENLHRFYDRKCQSTIHKMDIHHDFAKLWIQHDAIFVLHNKKIGFYKPTLTEIQDMVKDVSFLRRTKPSYKFQIQDTALLMEINVGDTFLENVQQKGDFDEDDFLGDSKDNNVLIMDLNAFTLPLEAYRKDLNDYLPSVLTEIVLQYIGKSCMSQLPSEGFQWTFCGVDNWIVGRLLDPIGGYGYDLVFMDLSTSLLGGNFQIDVQHNWKFHEIERKGKFFQGIIPQSPGCSNTYFYLLFETGRLQLEQFTYDSSTKQWSTLTIPTDMSPFCSTHPRVQRVRYHFPFLWVISEEKRYFRSMYFLNIFSISNPQNISCLLQQELNVSKLDTSVYFEDCAGFNILKADNQYFVWGIILKVGRFTTLISDADKLLAGKEASVPFYTK